ncbi:MAG: pyrroline-5-carboxylate reductase [Planifilum fimeticola]
MNGVERICFIGAGSMAEAMLAGLLKKRRIDADKVSVFNRHKRERLDKLKGTYGVWIPENRGRAVSEADTVILAVKPKDVQEALTQWRSFFHKGQRIISVAAGVSTEAVEKLIPAGIPVIRAMPNTSCTIGLSATALCAGRWATQEDMEAARYLFSAIGSTVIVEEEAMDSVTALSGSGPAYIYFMVEALEQAGVEAGLSKEISRELTLQTLLGAAHMLMETREEPAELRRRVTSPGGTTMAGLEELKRRQFDEAVKSAVLRAKSRSRELGSLLGQGVK